MKKIMNATVSMVRTGDTVLLDAVYQDGVKLFPAEMLTVADIDHARATGITVITDTLGNVTPTFPRRSCAIIRH